MDVDTPSGTNSGAGKKRFEVKKVGLASAFLKEAREARIWLAGPRKS